MHKPFLAVLVLAGILSVGGCGGSSGLPVGDSEANSRSPIVSDSSGSGRLEESATVSTPSSGETFFAPAKSSRAEAFGGFGTSADVAHSSLESSSPLRNNGLQSGTLTAGRFDDVANFSVYRRFLERDGSHVVPVKFRGQQTLVTVTDAQGNPLGDARCLVTRSAGQQSRDEELLLDATTGTDGRVMLLTGPHDHYQSTEVRLQVSLPGHHSLVFDEIRRLHDKLNIVIDQAEGALPTQLDLALVIDTTGSMGDELEYLKTEIDSIVESVNQMFPNVDQRYALVTYRDKGDAYVCRSFDFTNSLHDFRQNLDQQSAAGGGDFPEAMDSALRNAEQLNWRTLNTAKVMFLVGDAPPHQQNIGNALNAVEGLRQKGVRVFPVGASGVETTAEIVMRTSALLTMGQYLFLTDHSGVGNGHATPDVPEFSVERLDRLMLRMIASELAGRRLAAQEIIAIEQGERHTSIRPINSTPFVGCYTSPAYSVSTSSVGTGWHLAFVVSWIGGHGIAALLAMIIGIVVFERLATRHTCR